MSRHTFIKDMAAEIIANLIEGGPGSGNWGHKGRPGKRGGSLPRGAEKVQSGTMAGYLKAKFKGNKENVSVTTVRPSAEKLQALFKGEKAYQYLKALRKAGIEKALVRKAFPHRLVLTSPKPKPPEVKKPEPKTKYPGFDDPRRAAVWMKHQYPWMDRVALTGLQPEIFNAVVRQYVAMADEYPEVARTVKQFYTQKMTAGRWADHSDLYTHQRIRLNSSPYAMGDKEKLDKSLKRAVEQGWHPPGCDTVESIITHEFGHAVKSYLGTSPVAFREIVDIETEGRGQALHKFEMKNYRDRETSQYALRNEQESFAEAFASMHHSPEGRQTAYVKKLGKLLDALKGHVDRPKHVEEMPEGPEKVAAIEGLKKFKEEVGLG